ncbi:tetraspanin-9-like isoform X2 [Mizuhopecten yessoensis]|uniref:tetraspanin-9-like isoform X2 n=1 Tax=Mizuhopecten yessoensis TaxID=6573 RepID=UPI000B45D6C3|nr:tetraspanin-9-like isoform X2 [Mizuhopecten yessoensis]
MSCWSDTGRWILVAVNVLCTLLGIALLVGGCLLKFGSGLIEVDSYIENTLAEVVLDGIEQSLSGVLDNIVIICIVAGAVIFILSLLGCLGACCEWKIALVIYSIIVFLVLAAEVALIVLVILFRTEIKSTMKDAMNQTLYETYDNRADNNVVIGWNTLFYKFECCGVDDYMDIQNAKNFTQTNPKFKVIPFCCKDIDFNYPKLTPPPGDSSYNCSMHPSPENSNYRKGCFQTLQDFLELYQNLFLGVGISLVVIQILCLVAACCICREIGDGGGKAV